MRDNFFIERLICPVCKGRMELTNDGRTLACRGERVHCFDFSAKGYVNLSLSQSATGDSKEAVRSRSDFLGKDYYRPIAMKLCELLKKYSNGGAVIDAGCGEGYYTSHIAAEGFSVAGFDLSKFAVASTATRLGCKQSETHFAAVSSVFELPLADECADAVVSIFAPCAEEESLRVLKEGGALIVVSAGREHLMGLKKAIYKEAYENDERADMPKQMKLSERTELSYSVNLTSGADIQNLFSMTPYYWRTSQSDKEKLSGLEELETEIDIVFSVYKK